MNEDELEKLAERIALQMDDNHCCCVLNEEEQAGVKEFLRTKKSAIKALIYIFAALTVYAMKDLWTYFVSHLSFK